MSETRKARAKELLQLCTLNDPHTTLYFVRKAHEHGLTIQEISTTLGVPETTTQSILGGQ